MSRATLGFSVRINALATDPLFPAGLVDARTAGRLALASDSGGVEQTARVAPLGHSPGRLELRSGEKLRTLPAPEVTMSDAQPITGLRPSSIAPFVFLCGDPARVPRIAKGWSGVTEQCRVREYLVVTGEL